MAIWHKGWVDIGDGVFIGGSCFIALIKNAQPGAGDPSLTIGDRTQIGSHFHVTCGGAMVIEEDVLISNRVYIGDSIHGYEDPYRPVLAQPMEFRGNIHLKAGCFIGANVVVHPGVTIGEHAVVGASAVVLSDVPAHAVAVGHPARVVKRFDEDSGKWSST
ncbi:MAG: acyltransferase [Solirubrobacteraceae bacterium]